MAAIQRVAKRTEQDSAVSGSNLLPLAHPCVPRTASKRAPHAHPPVREGLYMV